MSSGLYLKDVAQVNKLDENLCVSVGDESLLLKLALVWNTEIARRYPKIVKEGELSAALPPAQWCGLAVIESVFAKLSHENSINPKEHELGVERFLKFLINNWEKIQVEEEEPQPPPNLYLAASCNLPTYLQAWLDTDDSDQL
jgi:hypothetical protein